VGLPTVAPKPDLAHAVALVVDETRRLPFAVVMRATLPATSYSVVSV